MPVTLNVTAPITVAVPRMWNVVQLNAGTPLEEHFPDAVSRNTWNAIGPGTAKDGPAFPSTNIDGATIIASFQSGDAEKSVRM
jgi:hypothetical protein